MPNDSSPMFPRVISISSSWVHSSWGHFVRPNGTLKPTTNKLEFLDLHLKLHALTVTTEHSFHIQHTRELIKALKTSHEHNNKDLSRLR